MVDYFRDLKEVLQEVALFCCHAGGRRLRRYQVEAAHAIVRSVVHKLGDTIVVMFPRQSGKNETQAQVEAYLLAIFSNTEIEMVKVSPTYKPQTENAMRRLERALRQNFVFDSLGYQKESGYIYRVGKSRLYFLSGAPGASVVGATATHLLECDEAQDVSSEKWDKDFAPMAASGNATRVFWGTAWTSHTLLARELRAARQREQETGRRLVFTLTADEVRREVPAYGVYVDEQVRRLGRNHPLVRTQYFSEEIDDQGGMFPAQRRVLMQSAHLALEAPRSGGVYCLLLDVAGEDENGEQMVAGMQLPLTGFGTDAVSLHNSGRDSTALTVVEVDMRSLEDELLRAPTYRVVNRYEWVGARQYDLYGRIKALAEHWQARYLVVDATGVGAGLASFLEKILPGRVIPFVFSQKSKSDLGWRFLALVETGRYKEHSAFGRDAACCVSTERGEISNLHIPEPPPSPLRSTSERFPLSHEWERGGDDFYRRGEGENLSPPVSPEAYRLQAKFWRQVEHCQAEILDGPGKTLRWGVPDGRRDPESGELVHDDLLISAALCGALDGQAWGVARSKTSYTDPLAGLEEVY